LNTEYEYVSVRKDILELYSGSEGLSFELNNNKYIGANWIEINAAPEHVNVKNDLFSGIN
jgi:hypothetical protein